ncbi:MAG: hypothetical protein LUC33_04415, partial [Prevotellaceae bacterium]|nr:hypothetical protein [Prevotellaceae bacterium]
SVNERSAGEIQKELLSSANFYKIASIDFRWFCQEELDKSGSESVRLSNSPFFSLEIERGTLNSLETRETLGEDEVSNGGYRGQSLFAYNNRLHIFGGEKKLPGITIPRRQNGLYHLSDSAAKVTQALVYVKTDDGLKGVTVTDNLSYPGFPWFFYPDSRATRLLLKCGDNTYRLVDLTPHDFLNGSYFFYGPDAAVSSAGYALPGTAQTEWDDTQYSEYEPMRNKIYVSEASDPFYFKNAMVCTAGSGQVLALSCAARALSQGQFGQFPLYAFTDEGIWNITVAGDGTYSASQPMARDVVTNVQAVTQLDSKVLFMADRGVMVATGSEVTCLSDSIDGDFGQLNPLDLPRFDEFCARFLDMDGDELSGRVEAWAGKTFFDFIKECLVKYDYTHQRLVVYSPPAGVAYVYSLKSRQWGMMLTDLQDGVNSYPDALALQSTDTDGEVELADLSEYDTQAEPSPMVFVTRPAKLGDADMMKTVMSLVQRGYMRQDLEENHTLGMALYGSLDCFHWEIVETTRTHRIDNIEGTPYKYFRLAVAVRLGFRENVRGFEALYDLRGTGKLR